MTNIPNKSDGQTLNAGDLFKIVGQSFPARLGGAKEGNPIASVSIDANSVNTGVIIVMMFDISISGADSASVDLWINTGSSGSETKAIKLPFNSDPDTVTSNINFSLRQTVVLAWYEDTLTWTDAQSVVCTESNATTSGGSMAIASLGLFVIGV